MQSAEMQVLEKAERAYMGRLVALLFSEAVLHEEYEITKK